MQAAVFVAVELGLMAVPTVDARRHAPKPKPSPTPTPTPTPAPTPTPVITPVPSGNLYTFPLGGSQAQFANALADLSLEAIAMPADTHHWRSVVLPDRTSRPLTILPVPGATVIFDNAGDGGRNPVFMGAGRHITFDGTGGRFRIQHTLVAQQGLLDFGGASFLSFRGFTVRDCAGNALTTSEESAHVVYLNGGCHDLLFEDFDVADLLAADEAGGVYGMNGLQLYAPNGPAIFNVTARAWTIQRANWATVVRNGSSGLVYDGWRISDCGHGGVPFAVDFGTDDRGTVTDCQSTASVAPPVRLGLMTDGGGNAWA
jgi:hypothetical protein